MATMTITQYNDLLRKKENMEAKIHSCHENSYYGNAYRNDLSPSEYKQISEEIKQLEQQIKNAVVIKTVILNKEFTVLKDNQIKMNIVIMVNPIATANHCVYCSLQSTVGRALIGKKVGDIVEVNADGNITTYEVINISD